MPEMRQRPQEDQSQGRTSSHHAESNDTARGIRGLASKRALAHARHLAEHGVPLFLAKPAMENGEWNPTGGHNGCGYWLPKGWQDAEPDPRVVDRWKPGMALCAVMGHAVDGFDVDPGKGGADSAEALELLGQRPRSYGQASTPSGGTHDLIAPLRVGSHDGIRPGVDLKGGRPDGTGRGFLFIAPTVKLSKATGELAAYRWTTPPDLTAVDPCDTTGAALAATAGVSSGTPSKASEGEMVPPPGRQYDALSPGSQEVARAATARRIEGWRTKLAEAADMVDGEADEKGRGWDKLAADAALTLMRLALAPWSPLGLDEAKGLFPELLPDEMHEERFTGKWTDARLRTAATMPPLVAPWAEDFQDDPPPLPEERPPAPPATAASTTAVLSQVEAFLRRFVAYPSDEARVAHVLWVAHTHLMDRWESTPRIAFQSPERGSGKTRALEATGPLVPNPVHAVNCTPAYLFRKVSTGPVLPTVLYDEIDTVFGPKAKDHEEVRGLLNAGHRRGAVAGRAVAAGRNNKVTVEELPAYCAVALAGLGNLPDTISSRSVIISMRRRTAGERVEPWRSRIHEAEAVPIFEALAEWAEGFPAEPDWPTPPSGVEDRDADVWEPLLTIAAFAGDDWWRRACEAAVALTREGKSASKTLGTQLLADLKVIFTGWHKVHLESGVEEGRPFAMQTSALIAALCVDDDSLWREVLPGGRQITSRWLGQQLSQYGIRSYDIKWDGKNLKGYYMRDFEDAWDRYVGGEES